MAEDSKGIAKGIQSGKSGAIMFSHAETMKLDPTSKLDAIFETGSGVSWHSSPETTKIRNKGLQAVYDYGKASCTNAKDLNGLEAQVVGLTKGISKFMQQEKSLRKRLAENERALAKRKKQTQIDSKQNAELFRDLFLVCDANVEHAHSAGVRLDVKRATFEEFKDGWLKQNGYKETA